MTRPRSRTVPLSQLLMAQAALLADPIPRQLDFKSRQRGYSLYGSPDGTGYMVNAEVSERL